MLRRLFAIRSLPLVLLCLCGATPWPERSGPWGPHVLFAASQPRPAAIGSTNAMRIERRPFGKTADGSPASLFTCTNEHGLVLKVTDYGALIVSLETPDRDGRLANVTLGHASLEGYLQRHPYFGATVGRYCNRIAKGRFRLDGKEYTLATNDGAHHLHGGKLGFDRVMWKAEGTVSDAGAGVRFMRRSPDGEEGYPGNLDVTVAYRLTKDNCLVAEFTATTDKPTPVNLTNHCYWNLGGAGSGKILEHELMIAADKYLPVDAGLIPTGETAGVEGTPFDFRSPRRIGERIQEIPSRPVGYDHCYVLRSQGGGLALAARVKERRSGRVMEIYTTQPGLQFYSGNFLDGSAANGGFQQYEGFCLETQHYPDSPNQPAFPPVILRPGETYRQTTVHRFFTE